MGWGYDGYREYVPVELKIARGKKYAEKIARKQKRKLAPVSISGMTIARTFWGKAWCDHLESYSDYSNRLPRGRTYARNGSVVDLQISIGRLEAIVAGSDPYEITVEIAPLDATAWKKLRNDCAASIDSLLDLLGGRFSDGIMQRLTDRSTGMFPKPREIHLWCSCPDGARLCKHLAAVLYGVGAHLDTHPELLFKLRGVDHTELVGDAVSADNLTAALGEPGGDLAGEDLGAMFGIELETSAAEEPAAKAKPKTKASRKRTAKRKAASKKSSKTQSPKKRSGAATPAKKKPAKKESGKKKAVKKKAVKKKAAAKQATTRKSATKKSKKKKSAATSVKKKSGRKKTSRK